MISKIAIALDEYLVKTASPIGKEAKPSMSINGDPRTLNVTEHNVFTVSLANGNQPLHVIKPIEIEDQDILLPTRNGSSEGVYELYPLKAGTTKIRVVAAHEKTLAVGSHEITVTVAAGH